MSKEPLINKHGLPRYIPADVRRQVRQRCGFGCIECGTAIIQYHHFNPEFVDAEEHKPEGITLLCSNCHEKVKKKIFKASYIERRNANPFCQKKGFAKDIFHLGMNEISFKMGGAMFRSLDVVIYENFPLIGFQPPTHPDEPFLLNATLYDKTGRQMLSIVENEWVAGIDQFDIETPGNKLIIREKLGEIKLCLSHSAEEEIYIENMNMFFRGFNVQVLSKQFIVKNPVGGRLQLACPNIYATLRLFSDGGITIGAPDRTIMILQKNRLLP